jgi:hypothetical protein
VTDPTSRTTESRATTHRPAGPRGANARAVLILAAGVASFLFGCGEQEPPRVDPALLGPALTDSLLGITFRPPSQLQAAAPEYVDQIHEQMKHAASRDDPFFIIPAMIFASPVGQARCFVSAFRTPPADGLTPEWKDRYLKQASERAAPASIETGSYEVGGAEVYDLKIEGEEVVNHRVLLAGLHGDLLQIDYFVSRQEYPSYAPAIESSIRSLVLF